MLSNCQTTSELMTFIQYQNNKKRPIITGKESFQPGGIMVNSGTLVVTGSMKHTKANIDRQTLADSLLDCLNGGILS
jgi:hypothetical protein